MKTLQRIFDACQTTRNLWKVATVHNQIVSMHALIQADSILNIWCELWLDKFRNQQLWSWEHVTIHVLPIILKILHSWSKTYSWSLSKHLIHSITYMEFWLDHKMNLKYVKSLNKKNPNRDFTTCGHVTAEVKSGGQMTHVHAAKEINTSLIKLYWGYFIVQKKWNLLSVVSQLKPPTNNFL